MLAALDECRWLYNRLLEQRKTAYEATGTGPTLYEAAGHLWGAQSRAPVAGRRA